MLVFIQSYLFQLLSSDVNIHVLQRVCTSVLYPTHTHTHTAIPYTIHVVAGAPPAIKPAPFLVVTLVSTRGHTNPIKLEPVESSDHSYSMESSMGTEMFSVEAADVGPITTIKVFQYL